MSVAKEIKEEQETLTLADKVAWLHKYRGDSVHVLEVVSLPLGDLSLFGLKLPGKIKVRTKSHGWLWIEKHGDYWNVALANGQGSHNPLWGSAYSVDILVRTGARRKHLGLTGAWKSAMTTWPVRDEYEARRVWDVVVSCIEQAYQHHKIEGRI